MSTFRNQLGKPSSPKRLLWFFVFRRRSCALARGLKAGMTLAGVHLFQSLSPDYRSDSWSNDRMMTKRDQPTGGTTIGWMMVGWLVGW